MKKYLREIEVAGMILMAIGVFLSIGAGSRYGMWPCVVGIVLWVATLVYKSFHWNEYSAENKRNITIMLVAIVILFLQMVMLWKH